MDILEYESVKRWLLNVQGKSKKLYTIYFREFCQFGKLTPDQLLAMAETNQGKSDVHNLAKQFFAHMEEQGLSSWTCTAAYSSVSSFMKWNDRQLGVMPQKFAGHVQYESDRILQPQETAKLIEHATMLGTRP